MRKPAAQETIESKLANLQPGELIFVGGRPVTGKTWIGVALAESYAREDKHVLFLTYEMPKKALTGRIATELLTKIHIEPEPLPFADLQTLTRKSTARFDAKLIILDYLQLIKEFEVEDGIYVMSVTKSLSEELHVPIVVFGQLHRAIDPSTHPSHEQIQKQNAVEKYADRIILIEAKSEPLPPE